MVGVGFPVAGSLRRHRAYTAFVVLADRTSGVNLAAYAHELENLFPAVDARSSTWVSYARVYLQWFEYAGLAVAKGSRWHPSPEGSPGVGELLGGRVIHRTKGAWPQRPARPVIDLLLEISQGEVHSADQARRGLRDLQVLGAVGLRDTGVPYLRDTTLVAGGEVVTKRLLEMMYAVPGVAEGLAVIKASPSARPIDVGMAIKEALAADWIEATTHGVGKNLRSWARYAGMDVKRVPRPRTMGEDQGETIPGLVLGLSRPVQCCNGRLVQMIEEPPSRATSNARYGSSEELSHAAAAWCFCRVRQRRYEFDVPAFVDNSPWPASHPPGMKWGCRQ